MILIISYGQNKRKATAQNNLDGFSLFSSTIELIYQTSRLKIAKI